jgi:hypothetical protein
MKILYPNLAAGAGHRHRAARLEDGQALAGPEGELGGKLNYDKSNLCIKEI